MLFLQILVAIEVCLCLAVKIIRELPVGSFLYRRPVYNTLDVVIIALFTISVAAAILLFIGGTQACDVLFAIFTEIVLLAAIFLVDNINF